MFGKKIQRLIFVENGFGEEFVLPTQIFVMVIHSNFPGEFILKHLYFILVMLLHEPTSAISSDSTWYPDVCPCLLILGAKLYDVIESCDVIN